MNRLPNIVDLHADEVPLSFAARLAAANGYQSLVQFLKHVGISRDKLFQGEWASSKALAVLAGVEPDMIARYAMRYVHTTLRNLGSSNVNVLRSFNSRHRFCPNCVEADLVAGIGRESTRPYVRFHWLVDEVTTCVVHGVPMHEWQAERDDWGDFTLFAARNRKRITAAAEIDVTVRTPAYQNYAVCRLAGEMTNAFLDQLDLDIALEFCRLFGKFLMKRSGRLLGDDPYDVGFQVASKGAPAIEEAVLQVAEAHELKSHNIRGFFGPILAWLAHEKDGGKRAVLADLIQDIGVRNFPLKKGTTFVTQVNEQNIHCVLSAGKAYSLAPRKVREALTAAGLLPHPELADSRIWFKLSLADPFLVKLTPPMNDHALARELGVSVELTRTLYSAPGLIGPESYSGDGLSPPRTRELLQFKELVFRDLPVVEEPGNKVDLVTAAKRANVDYAYAVKAAKERRFKTLVRMRQRNLLSCLRVDWEDFRDTMASFQ